MADMNFDLRAGRNNYVTESHSTYLDSNIGFRYRTPYGVAPSFLGSNFSQIREISPEYAKLIEMAGLQSAYAGDTFAIQNQGAAQPGANAPAGSASVAEPKREFPEVAANAPQGEAAVTGEAAAPKDKAAAAKGEAAATKDKASDKKKDAKEKAKDDFVNNKIAENITIEEVDGVIKVKIKSDKDYTQVIDREKGTSATKDSKERSGGMRAGEFVLGAAETVGGAALIAFSGIATVLSGGTLTLPMVGIAAAGAGLVAHGVHNAQDAILDDKDYVYKKEYADGSKPIYVEADNEDQAVREGVKIEQKRQEDKTVALLCS